MSVRLVEGLSFEWRGERRTEALLRAASCVADTAELVAALSELLTSSRTRRNRLERRLETLGARVVLAPLPEPLDRLDEGLERGLAATRAAADRYAALAELARQLRDPETAFACELNRIGAEEAASLLDVLLAAMVERIGAGAPAAPAPGARDAGGTAVASSSPAPPG